MEWKEGPLSIHVIQRSIIRAAEREVEAVWRSHITNVTIASGASAATDVLPET